MDWPRCGAQRNVGVPQRDASCSEETFANGERESPGEAPRYAPSGDDDLKRGK